MSEGVRGYLLDTCVLLETLRATPNEGVVRWMEEVDQNAFYISAITVGELMGAIEGVGQGDERTALRRWVLSDMQGWFKGHILNFTPEVAAFWGPLSVRLGRDVSPLGGVQAAFALKNNLALVSDERIDLPHLRCINPWS